MISTSKLLLTLALLSLFLFPVFTLKVGASNGDMAKAAISNAEETVASAYEAVLEAEQAKANVSGLLGQLNNASKYLADAHMLYRLGDFNGANYSASLSSEIAEEVRSSAEELKTEAFESWITNVWIRITCSIIGAVAVIFGTFIVWRVFKRGFIFGKNRR